MPQEKTRTFICINPPTEIIKELIRIQDLLLNSPFIGKTTEPENLHLTLKFLGELTEEEIESTKEKLRKIKFNKFKSELMQTGNFKFRGSPKIVWVKIKGKDLLELQKKIDVCLEDKFEKEKKFMSHLTIARIKYVKDSLDFINKLRAIQPKKLSFDVEKFYLMSSKLDPIGPTYKILEEFSLQ